MNNSNRQEKYNVSCENNQLVLVLNSEILLPEDAPVRVTSAQLEELDYRKLYEAYSSKGRKSVNDPRVLFKVMVYGYQCGNCVRCFIQKKQSGQQAMFAESEPGDTIIVLEVSRLARSTQQLCEIIEIIREKHLRLVIVGSITLDCRNGHPDPMSEAFLQMAGVFSQLELAMIRSRVRSGMENARAKGRQIGRPQITVDDLPSGFLRHYPAYKSGQLNISELARVCDLSRTTVYRYIRLIECK